MVAFALGGLILMSASFEKSAIESSTGNAEGLISETSPKSGPEAQIQAKNTYSEVVLKDIKQPDERYSAFISIDKNFEKWVVEGEIVESSISIVSITSDSVTYLQHGKDITLYLSEESLVWTELSELIPRSDISKYSILATTNFTFNELSNGRYVLVVTSDDQTGLDYNGLVHGDKIMTIEGVPIGNNRQSVRELLEEAINIGTMLVSIDRNGEIITRELALD